MSNNPDPKSESTEPTVYQIRVKGHLGVQWADWLEGFTITLEESGDTLFVGQVVDQAALYGVIKKIQNVGISLVSVNAIESEKTEKEKK